MSTFNLFNTAQKVNEAISGANLFFKDGGYTGNARLLGSAYLQQSHSQNHFVEQNSYITGNQIVYGSITGLSNANLNNLSATGNAFFKQITGGLQVTGNSNHSGDFTVVGSLIVNGNAITGSAVQNITNNITGADFSTGDFTVSGHLRVNSGILITGTRPQLLSISGNNSSLYNAHFVGITGKTPANTAVKIHNGSLQVTGVGAKAYLQGGHKSDDGSEGSSVTFSLSDVNALTFKDGILISVSYNPTTTTTTTTTSLPYSYSLQYDVVNPSTACSYLTPITYYSTSPSLNGAFLFDDIGGSTEASNGYYSDGTDLYYYTQGVGLSYNGSCA